MPRGSRARVWLLCALAAAAAAAPALGQQPASSPAAAAAAAPAPASDPRAPGPAEAPPGPPQSQPPPVSDDGGLLGPADGGPPPPVLPGGPPLPSAEAVRRLDGLPSPVPWAGGADPAFPFVRARGTQLVTGEGAAEAPLYVVGANMWHAAWLAPHRLAADLDALKGAGVTVVRLLAGAEGPDTEPWCARGRGLCA